MSNVAWASYAMAHPSSKLFVRNALEDNPQHPLIDNGNRNEAGEPLGPENFPKEIWGIDEFDDNKGLPHLFFGYGPWVVSAAVADILRQVDMGRGALYPIEVYKKDRKTPMGGRWFCLNFGNVKQAFRASDSPKTVPAGPSRTRWRLPYVLTHNDLAVSSAALEGPDIWIDPIIKPTFFVSDRLAKSLKDAGLDKAFSLKKCRVI